MLKNIDRDRLLYNWMLSWPILRHKYGRPLKKWLRAVALLIAVSAGALAYGLALAWAPRMVDSTAFAAATAEAKLNAVHNARVLVLSVGGAVVVGIGLLYTARNYRLAHRGQMTDRFTKALERLGSSEMYLRVGAVRALEHVMRDSPGHHADTVEVLISFIRDRTRLRSESQSLPAPKASTEPDPDVQAALSALCHRPRRSEREPLNLSDLDLRGASFRGGDLRYAEFFNSALDGAYFIDAKVTYASFMHASLSRSWFSNADIRRSNFDHSTCSGAYFHKAKARGSSFLAAVITRAHFTSSDLRGAVFLSADMTDAKLGGADLRRAYFVDEDGTDEAVGLTEQQLEQARLVSGARIFSTTWLARLASYAHRRRVSR
ncbi:pentapeptide repeat-containing protein [Micromonospora sp. NPDC006766]|uniref:pentapeptide repeat-containing protein n=1 Tax=Micromonospora sp. NPDC006766 TaxID=3154778 RepID=UPI0033CFF092